MQFALRIAHQRYLFINSKHQKSDAFQVTIELLVVTARKIYIKTQAVCAKCLNDLKGIPFVVPAVHEQEVPMSSSWSKTHLLLYIHEQFAMSLHLLCSTILHVFTTMCKEQHC